MNRTEEKPHHQKVEYINKRKNFPIIILNKMP